MKLPDDVPNLKKVWQDKTDKSLKDNPQHTLLIGLLQTLTGNNGDYVGSTSHQDAIRKFYEMQKTNDYSLMSDIINDLETYYNAMESLMQEYRKIVVSHNYMVCEKCGDISGYTDDETGKWMNCCGNTEQSEFTKEV